MPIFPLKYKWEENPLPHNPSYYPSLAKHSVNQIKKPQILWNSWTCYGTSINEEIILQEAEAIREKGLPVDTIVIDDGWCKLGDYDTPDPSKFPHGLSSLVKNLKKLNFSVGIWLAPFMAELDSKLVKNYPSLLLKNNKGFPINAYHQNYLFSRFAAPRYQLNTQGEKFLTILEQQIDFLVNSGISLLKLDFLFLPFFEPHKDDSAPSIFLHNFLKSIKIKYPHVYTLACGCPFEPARFVVDAIRVGPDSTWPPQSAPRWLRKIVYKVRKKDNLYKYARMLESDNRYYALDRDVIMYDEEWENSYNQFRKNKEKILGIGYSLHSKTF